MDQTSFLKDVPPGFFSAAKELSDLLSDDRRLLIHSCAESIFKSKSSSSSSPSTPQNENASSFVRFVFSEASRLSVTLQTFGLTIQRSAGLSQEAAEDLIRTFSTFIGAEAEATSPAPSLPAFDIGRLVDFQWKLSVAVQSNSGKKLMVPRITAMVRVAAGQGEQKEQNHVFEMELPQFHEFARALRSANAAMETV